MAKNPVEIMEIFASYDLTRCAWSAAQLVGCDPKTVQRYVDLREAGLDPLRRTRRARLIDPYLEKVEELVEDSHGKIRADVVHDRLRAMGFAGNERTTRRAVAAAKKAYRAGRRRSYRPWLPEPGKWLQFDWGDGPRVNGRRTWLFCAWLAWSRYRVVRGAPATSTICATRWLTVAELVGGGLVREPPALRQRGVSSGRPSRGRRSQS